MYFLQDDDVVDVSLEQQTTTREVRMSCLSSLFSHTKSVLGHTMVWKVGRNFNPVVILIFVAAITDTGCVGKDIINDIFALDSSHLGLVNGAQEIAKCTVQRGGEF